jgi:hypothetical protein
MGKPHKGAPSTEPPPFGLPLDEMSAEFRRDLSRVFGLPPDLASLREALADPERVTTALRHLSGNALVMLDHLVELGGHVEAAELTAIAVDEHGMSPSEVEHVYRELALAALALRVQTTDPGRPSYGALATFDVLEEPLVSRVRGVSLPAPPADAPTIDVWMRDVVALLATVVHAGTRITQQGDVHRGTAKKLANLVGWPADRVTTVIDFAIRAGILGRRGDMLAPVRPRLAELARGERTLVPTSDGLALLHAMPEGRWLPEDALARALAAHRMRGLLRAYPHLRASPQRRALLRREARRDVAWLPLPRLVGDEHVFVRRPSPGPRSGQGDGHVTPSFEVMLGPAADPELVATIALCTEPSRFDLVLTRKITPASVTAGCAVGLDVEAMLDALGRVGKHPVPDNVRAMVEEWAARAKTVRIRDVLALEVTSKEAADAIARTLDADVVARPSPTVLLVQRSAANVAARIQKAGAQVVDAIEPLATGDRPPAGLLARDVKDLLAATGDPALRARVEQGSPSAAVDEEDDAPVHPVDRLIDCAASLPPEAKAAHAFLDVLRHLWEAAGDEYAQWANALASDARDRALTLAALAPWQPLAWLARPPRKRSKLLAGAKSIEQLLALASDLKDGTFTTLGIDALRLAKHPEVIARVLEADWTDARHVEPERAEVAPKLARETPREAPARPEAEQLALAALPTSTVEQTFEAKKAAFVKAAAEGAQVVLRVRVPGQPERRVIVQPERIVERGNDVAFLALDVEQDEGRSFPVASVIAVEPA